MADVNRALARIKKEYPSPEVDPVWVRECVQALIDDGQQPTPEAIIEQYLFSDLSTSTLPSPLPTQINLHNTHLFPIPTLVQLHSITEIASSAFQLQTVADQRRDILEGTTRIRRMDDEVEGEEVVDEGKIPAYPRGMLRVEVGDGRWVLKGMEYRRIGDLKLGETALGCKLILHNVRVLRGVLLLSPDNTQVLGYQVDHLESEQPKQFIASLKERLGQAAKRVQKPTQSNIDKAPKKRITLNAPVTSSKVKSDGAAKRRAAIASGNAEAGPSRTKRPASAQKSKQQPPQKRGHFVDDDEPNNPGSDFEIDDQFDDSFMRNIDQVESQNRPRTQPRQARAQAYQEIDEDDDGEEGFEVDESFIRQVEVVERSAARGSTSNSYGRVGERGSGYEREVIEISD